MSCSDGNIVLFRRAPAELNRNRLERFARTLRSEVAKGAGFTCLIAGDAHLRRLNRDFRGKDYATDVLSFPSLPDSPEIGEIAISAPRARAQGAALGHSIDYEIRILMLHGLLHLMGLDHESDNGRMRRAESRWRKRFGLPVGLIERAEGA